MTELADAVERNALSVSHELRTPLTMILGAAEVLSARLRQQPELIAAVERIERIERTANDTAARVSALLLLARAPRVSTRPAQRSDRCSNRRLSAAGRCWPASPLRWPWTRGPAGDGSGTGLGLAIVRRIAEHLDWQIEFEVREDPAAASCCGSRPDSRQTDLVATAGRT